MRALPLYCPVGITRTVIVTVIIARIIRDFRSEICSVGIIRLNIGKVKEEFLVCAAIFPYLLISKVKVTGESGAVEVTCHVNEGNSREILFKAGHKT